MVVNKCSGVEATKVVPHGKKPRYLGIGWTFAILTFYSSSHGEQLQPKCLSLGGSTDKKVASGQLEKLVVRGLEQNNQISSGSQKKGPKMDLVKLGHEKGFGEKFWLRLPSPFLPPFLPDLPD